MYKNLISIIVAVAVIVAILLGGYFLWQKIAGVNIDETTIVTVEGIKKIAELATIEYHVSVFEHKTETSDILHWWPKDYMVYIEGTVIGSIDLNKSQIVIDTANKHVDMKFQKDAINIHNPEIGKGDTYLVTCKDLFNPVHPQDWQALQDTAKGRMRSKAIEKGIIEKTANEARVILGGFLDSFGYTSEIVFNDSI